LGYASHELITIAYGLSIPLFGAIRATSTYAAIFELDGDPADVLRAMNATAESGEMHMRDAIDGSSFSMSA